jgi:hypothetical protein
MPGVTTAYQSGVHGSRPAATAGCILYACSTHSLIYRSDGTTWTTWMTIGSSTTTVATDAIWDTAGDLAVGTGADTAAKLAAVATGKVLASKGSGVAPAWDYPPFHGARATANANTSMTTAGTAYVIALATEDYDSDAFHDTVTNNSRLTIPTGMTGKFVIRGQTYVATAAGKFVDLKIRKNGAAGTILSQARVSAADANTIIQVTAIASLAAADYVELYATSDSAAVVADATASMFEIALLGV